MLARDLPEIILLRIVPPLKSLQIMMVTNMGSIKPKLLPSEKELLFTYSLIEDVYVGGITNAETEKPITAARIPAIAISHIRRHSVLKT